MNPSPRCTSARLRLVRENERLAQALEVVDQTLDLPAADAVRDDLEMARSYLQRALHLGSRVAPRTDPSGGSAASVSGGPP